MNSTDDCEIKESIPTNSNIFIEQQLEKRLLEIEDFFSADGLTFSGQIFQGIDDIVRNAIEKKKANSNNVKKEKLFVILTTNGGYIGVVQRIVDIFRYHYKIVDFIIPNYAYSAGTVLAMSGDDIYMDYYSRLGPIDPQVENKSGRMVPALGYLEQYGRLIEKAKNGEITTAEVQLLLSGFDQAELYHYEQARQLSISLLKKWLSKYKFKNWKITESRKMEVTEKMREDRAAWIAEQLNDTNRWHVHGHGISMEVLRKDLNLLINDFGENEELDSMIKSYYNLLEDYMLRTSCKCAIHTTETYQSFK